MKNQAVKETKRYHTTLYRNVKLFKKGSWLDKPDTVVMNLARKLGRVNNLLVLDLGAGVGRHAIPIAKIIGKNNGKVICVDYLKVAEEKLIENSIKYHVEEYVDSHFCDVSRFHIKKDNYNLIIAHSVLEHLNAKKLLASVIKNMILGTKKGGYNYIIFTTQLEEYEVKTKKKIAPQIEINLGTREASRLITKLYRNWRVISLRTVPYREILKRNKQDILWKCKYISLIAKK